jgi:hypothetical protein
MVSERSAASFVLALLAAGMLAWSLSLPWFEYDHTTGRRTPEGGYHDPEDTGVVHTHLEARPGEVEGDVQPTDPGKADTLVQQMQWAVYAAIGLLVLVALGEIPGISRVLVRPVGLSLSFAALASTGFALALLWFSFPDTLAGYGVTKPFTYFQDESGYTRTTIRMGWTVAAASLPVTIAGFLFKFQAGAPDPTAVAELAAQGEI